MKLKTDLRGALLSALMPEGEIGPGYVDDFLAAIEERQDAYARERAADAADMQRLGEAPIDAAARRFGSLKCLMEYTSKDSEPILLDRALNQDKAAGVLWLFGIECGLWKDRAGLVQEIRETCELGLEEPKPARKAKPMSGKPTKQRQAAILAETALLLAALNAGRNLSAVADDPDADRHTKLEAVTRFLKACQAAGYGRKMQ